MASHQDIYKGFWTNRAQGQVAGATLTLSRQDGAYLIAFLALFVHISGASFWRLISFGTFYHRAYPEQKNNLILQQQAILRNGSSAISSLRGFVRILLRSRDLRRNLSLIAWACLNVAGFLAAGILSSKVTSTRSDVLLKPIHCGQWWQYPDDLTPNNLKKVIIDEAIHTAALGKLQIISSTYATACYNSGSNPDSCTRFGRRPPSWESAHYSGCPFGDLCIDNMTFSIDSGYIASDLDLGINSHPDDRISLRLRVECAPLKHDEYMKVYHADDISSLFQDDVDPEEVFFEPTKPFRYEAFFYGPTTEWALWKSPATFIWNNGTIAYSLDASGQDAINSLDVMSAEFGSHGQLYDGSRFDPISQLVIPERQVTLVFLSSNAFYSAIVTDPWFKAERESTSHFTFPEKEVNFTTYHRDPSTTVLGCAENFELCHGTSDENRRCLSFGSDGLPYGPGSIAEILQLSQRQKAISQRLLEANSVTNLVLIIIGEGARGLLAYQYYTTEFEAPLPDNQWTLEVEHWFSTILILLQSTTTLFVTGVDSRFDALITPPPKADEWMCQNQVVQRSDYASFSVLGICIILILGGSFIEINAVVDRFCRLVLRRTQLNEFRQTSWDANELLELQAAASHGSSKGEPTTDASDGEAKVQDTFTEQIVDAGQESPSEVVRSHA